MAKEQEAKTVLERVYTVPLRASFRKAPSYRKTNRAVKAVRDFLAKHMKSEDVRLGQHLNQFLWQHGIRNPPPRVTVKAVKDDEGVVKAELEGKAYKESVRPTPKEEAPSTLKEKLADKLGAKEEKGEKRPATKGDAEKSEEPAAEKAEPEKAKAPTKDSGQE